MTAVSKLKKRLPLFGRLLENLLKTETIFYLAVILIPFENLAFAPSSGWATVSPLLFAVYLVLNFKHIWSAIKKFHRLVIFFIIAGVLGLITALIHYANFYTLVDACFPIALGLMEFFTFYIYYYKTKNLHLVVSLLVFSYAIVAVIGFFEFLAIQTENKPLIDILSAVMKRSYLDIGRVHFFFTEPSFIGMHIFGIMLPLFLVTRRKDILFIALFILLESVLFGAGIRIVVDAFVVGLFYIIYLIIRHKKYFVIPVILLSGLVAFCTLYTANWRFQNIVNHGVYSDGSLASRYFRIQSTAIGYTKSIPSVIFGYGLGNSITPAQAGYEEAEPSYDNDFRQEVDSIGDLNYHDDNITFSLQLRCINEFGLIMFIVALAYLIKLTKNSTLKTRFFYFAVVFYLYLQFESYAFYALWLFILIMYFTQKTLLAERAHLKILES